MKVRYCWATGLIATLDDRGVPAGSTLVQGAAPEVAAVNALKQISIGKIPCRMFKSGTPAGAVKSGYRWSTRFSSEKKKYVRFSFFAIFPPSPNRGTYTGPPTVRP